MKKKVQKAKVRSNGVKPAKTVAKARKGVKKKAVKAVVKKVRYVNPLRVTRSVAFHNALIPALKARAKEVGRSVNWVINDMVERDCALPIDTKL